MPGQEMLNCEAMLPAVWPPLPSDSRMVRLVGSESAAKIAFGLAILDINQTVKYLQTGGDVT